MSPGFEQQKSPSKPAGGPNSFPSTPWQLYRFLRHHPKPRTPVASKEHKKALRAALAEMVPSPLQSQEKNILRWSLISMLVLHTAFATAALLASNTQTLMRRGDQMPRLQAAPTVYIAPQPTPPKEPPKTEKAPEEDMAALAAPTPPKPKKVLKKKKIQKKLVKKASKKVEEAPKPQAIAKVVASESETAPQADVATVDDTGIPVGDTAVPIPETTEAEVVAEPEAPTIDLEGLRHAYLGTVHRALQEKRRYPRSAKRAGLEGKVVVEVQIDATGLILSHKVLRSSGHSMLDRAALDTVTSMGKLPAPPSALEWKTRSMKVPFVYKIS